ncbi:hypothetical protein L1987_27503 [Smallanthus sonchifolius]|uniref:Uncharacterized protein n=1 Tax=Smallanthus sonchifolius TaxID=185202 RepID=A0ACB9ICS2_9ASTR|nr:hypothetical protein L1987_27503 [Smallanthus sonchifolius]
MDRIINLQVPDNSTSGLGYHVVPHPFNCNFTVMPQEDEVTSYVSCASSSANSVSESDKSDSGSIKKGIDDGIMEIQELSEEVHVYKNKNIPSKNCILVKPDSPVQVEVKVEKIVTKPKQIKKIKFVKANEMQQEVAKIEKISNTDFT